MVSLFFLRATVYGSCRKFLLLFGRIGPHALRPCTRLRAWVFLSHSINILQIPWWYGDMDWYGMSCARSCGLLRGPAFLMPLYHALKILSPPKMWLKGRFFYISIYTYPDPKITIIEWKCTYCHNFPFPAAIQIEGKLWRSWRMINGFWDVSRARNR